MYSILLVDDEQYIRQSIIELVQWEKKGFYILGEASNGEEALELMEKNVPDILITDIRMPVMDGIELSRRIREKHPSVKIVFLSGHDDFDYAVSGIKLNIIEYLLKPISIKDLELMLEQVHEVLDEEKSEANDLKKIQTEYLENFQGIKMSFLVSLITDNYKDVPELEIKKLIKTYRLNLKGERNVLLNVNIDKSTLKKGQTENHDLEMMKFSLANVIRRIVNKYLDGEVFNFTSNIVVMLSDSKENIDLYKDIIVKEISESTQKLFHFSVGMGVSEEYDSLSGAKSAFQSSISALNYGLIMKKNKEVYISDIETIGLEKMIFDEANETKLISLIKIGSKKELSDFIDELFKGFNNDNQTHLQIFLMELYVSVLKAYKSVIPIYDTDMLQRIQMISDIHHYQEIEEIREWFKEFCLTVIESIQSQRKKK
ncbi:MAG: response regulator, partial [Carnobacterium sp.]